MTLQAADHLVPCCFLPEGCFFWAHFAEALIIQGINSPLTVNLYKWLLEKQKVGSIQPYYEKCSGEQVPAEQGLV